MPRMCSTATLLADVGPLRIMTTHLEFYSKRQRMAQAQALAALYAQVCEQAAQPPLDDESGGPFQKKVHTSSALLCGDFNFELSDPEYACIQQTTAGGGAGLSDAWRVRHGERPHEPTFRLFDRRYGPEPVCCDFVFVSDDLKCRVKQVEVNTLTRASDHQPVLIELI
jgi:endonuclease/exonuclease/phosphatase family metal-dependent hydrolase